MTIAQLANIRLGWKGLLAGNTLAYFILDKSDKDESFETQQQVSILINLFPLSFAVLENKLDCL